MYLEQPEIEPAAPALAPAAMAVAPDVQPAAAVTGAAVRAKRIAAARSKRLAADDSPESLALARREQSLAPYARAVQAAQARLDRFGVLDRLQGGEDYARARERLDLVKSAYSKVEAALDERMPELIETARLKLAPPAAAPASVPAPRVSAGIELDPRHARRRAPVMELGE